MNRYLASPTCVAAALSLSCILAAPLAAQAVAEPAPAAAAANGAQSDDRVVELSPFEVEAVQDNSYNVLDTNSITRFRTELYKLPVTAEVFTETFMQDTASIAVEDMITTYGGASVISLDAGASASFNNQPGDRVGSIGTPSRLAIRGLHATVHRDGFLSPAPTSYGISNLTDNFSAERVDMTSGAHSLLYGNSGGGGVVNIISKQARFRQKPTARVEGRFDQYGSARGSLDFSMGGDKIAFRMALLTAQTEHRRANLGGTANGIYGQVAFRLPFKSTLRLSHQYTDSFMVTASGNGNINNFLSPTDPRRNLNLNYLVASNQLNGLENIFTPGFDLTNVDSVKGWTASNWNKDNYSNVLLETTISSWLSSQFSFSYDDAVYDSPNGSSGLIPAGFGGNPTGMTAIQHTNPGDALAHTRLRGWRFSMLATNDFFNGKAKSQTILGAEATGRDGGQNGVAYSYYLLNPDGTVYVNPANVTNGEYGRIRLTSSPTLWEPVQNGLNAKPFFRPMKPIVYAINPTAGTPNSGEVAQWVRLQRRRIDPALRSPTNPLGADRTGNNGGEYNIGHSRYHAYTLANVTDWFDGKIQTLAGVRYNTGHDTNVGPNSFTAIPHVRKTTYSAGVSYQLLPWLRPFANISSAFSPTSQPNDPLGTRIKSPEGAALVPDVGVKIRAFDNRVHATITYVPQNTIKNDRANIDNSHRDAINPDGINGRFLGTGGGFQGTVNTDRQSEDLDISMTMSLARNWRTRLAFHYTDGTFKKSVTYPQVYNDQFHTNSSGQVTYGAGGPAVMVNATTGAVVTSGGVPLTVALINSPTQIGNPSANNPLYADPDPDSGRIRNTVLRTALTSIGSNGAVPGTGAVGLPLSAMQYNWGDPNGHNGIIEPILKGDKTIGYPRYTFSFTNKYDFDSGFLRGFGVLTSVNAAYEFRSHYYPTYGAGQTPGVTPFNQLERQLYVRPTVATFDLGLTYSRRIGDKYMWSAQVNVENVLNHYKILYLPNTTSANPPVNNYLMTEQPRMWIFSTSLSM